MNNFEWFCIGMLAAFPAYQWGLGHGMDIVWEICHPEDSEHNPEGNAK